MLATSLVLAGCVESEGSQATGEAEAALEAACSGEGTPADAWTCDAIQTLECTCVAGAEALATIYVESESCDALEVQHEVDLCRPGAYGVTVSDADGALCGADVEVVDRAPPVLNAHDVELWPPNHKMHAVMPEDCAEAVDACSGEVTLRFTWWAADEPDDDRGDGNTTEDVVAGCDRVELRSERRGGGAGRTYHLGVSAEDAEGNRTEGVCTVFVPHDQGGPQDQGGSPPGEGARTPIACEGDPE
ncbi:MAG: hypothetical protein ACYTF3_00720 [Planctomycetota bacterium]